MLGDDYIKLWTDFVDKMPSAREVIAGQVAAQLIHPLFEEAVAAGKTGSDESIKNAAATGVAVANAILNMTRGK